MYFFIHIFMYSPLKKQLLSRNNPHIKVSTSPQSSVSHERPPQVASPTSIPFVDGALFPIPQLTPRKVSACIFMEPNTRTLFISIAFAHNGKRFWQTAGPTHTAPQCFKHPFHINNWRWYTGGCLIGMYNTGRR